MEPFANILHQTIVQYNQTLAVPQGFYVQYVIMVNTGFGFVCNFSLTKTTTNEKVTITNFLTFSDKLKDEILQSVNELMSMMGM